jgi:hypothetical protein
VRTQDPNLDSRANNKAYSNDVSSVGPALMLNAIIGAACLTGFLVFRMLQPHYQLRQVRVRGGSSRVFFFVCV